MANVPIPHLLNSSKCSVKAILVIAIALCGVTKFETRGQDSLIEEEKAALGNLMFAIPDTTKLQDKRLKIKAKDTVCLASHPKNGMAKTLLGLNVSDLHNIGKLLIMSMDDYDERWRLEASARLSKLVGASGRPSGTGGSTLLAG